MKVFKSALPYLIILVFVLYACAPLFSPGFYPMHDDEQIGRLYDLNASLEAGHVPPRIVPNLGFGYGYPFFNFYPPFAYYVGEIFYVLGFGLIVSTKLMVFSGFLLSALFMYLLAKQFFGKIGGTISAVSYTLLSYKAVDVYARGAYAEFYAFVPLPLIFLSIYKIGKHSRSWFILWNALSVVVLVLSHNLIALMSVPFIGIWLLVNLYFAKSKIAYVVESSASFMLGFGLTAYFFIPSYLERGQTLINILTTELANYSLHFVCTYQLWGYGGSIPSCFDGISFEVGKVELVLSVIVLGYAVFKLLKSKTKDLYISVISFFLMLVLSLFFMVKFSKPLWDAFPPFWYVQFPWRFLLFAGLFASLLSGGVVLFLKKRSVLGIVVVIVFALLLYFSNGKFVPQRQFNATDADYIEKIRWETSGLAYEYVPKGIQTYISDIGTTKIDITENEVASSSSIVISGEMSVQEEVNKPHLKKFEVDAVSPGVFQINTFSFPGWKVYVDQEEVNYADSNKLKLIQINLAPGSHIVEARFEDTPVRLVGNLISGISIIIACIIVFVLIRKHKKM